MELKINNHDYKFSEPWFDAIKPGWDQIFEWYSKEFSIDNVLEIGCFEGKATTYMCEKWLKDKTSYTVLDTFGGSESESGMVDIIEKLKTKDYIYESFTHNISFFPNIDFTIKRGYSQHILPQLESEGKKYDFIYIDASHQSDDTFVDAYWAHKMLNVGGLIIFDDYGWSDPTNTHINHSPKLGIDVFYNCYQDKYNMIMQGYQVALVKK